MVRFLTAPAVRTDWHSSVTLAFFFRDVFGPPDA
jgi:hypothetical protein